VRVLILATPRTEAVAVLVPVAHAVGATGHEVLVAGQPDVLGPASRAGLPTVAVGPAYGFVDAVRAEQPPGPPAADGPARPTAGTAARSALPLLAHARYLLTPYLELARSWRPDLVLCDPGEYSAAVVAAALGVPLVHLHRAVDPYAQLGFGVARRFLVRRLDRLGLSELPGPALVLDPYPAALSPADPDGPPVQRIRLGTPAPPGTAAAGAPVRVRVDLSDNGRELAGRDLLGTVRTALSALPWLQAADTGYQLVVLDGPGMPALAACAAGARQLVLPQLPEDAEYAERIAGTGAGRGLPRAAQSSPETIARAVGELLADPAAGTAAAQIAAQVATAPTPAGVVDRLAELAQTGTTRLHPALSAG
jgi:hypothetical protein